MASDKVHFGHVLFLHAARLAKKDAWRPRVDVHRVPGGWLVKIELAGVRPEDVRVTVRDGSLLLQGARRDESRCDGLDCYRMEITYSRFERILELPGITEAAEISATYLGGILVVRIVKEGLP
jgi:HSP20 family protein